MKTSKREVDGLEYVSDALTRIADAITFRGCPTVDSAGITVASLTEAVMGHTAAMMAVAESIEMLADAVDNHNKKRK